MTTGLLDASVPCAMGCEGSYGIYFGKEEMLYYLNNFDWWLALEKLERIVFFKGL